MNKENKKSVNDFKEIAKEVVRHFAHCADKHEELLQDPDRVINAAVDKSHPDQQCMNALIHNCLYLGLCLSDCVTSGAVTIGETKQPAPQAQPATKPQPQPGSDKQPAMIEVPPGATVVDTKDNPIMGMQLMLAVMTMRQFAKDHGTMYHPTELLKRLHSVDPKVKADTEKLAPE